MPTRRAAAVVALLAILALAACATEGDATSSGADPAVSPIPATEERVIIRGRAFEPNEISVAVDTTVTWVNEDEQGHTITHGTDGTAAVGSRFDQPISAGRTVSYTFQEPGEYPVTCTIHPDMQMTVTVTGEDAEDAEGQSPESS